LLALWERLATADEPSGRDFVWHKPDTVKQHPIRSSNTPFNVILSAVKPLRAVRRLTANP
jgi:hypothetical protein